MKRLVFALLLLCCGVELSLGQFYSTGRGSSATPLSRIKTDKYQLIFPTQYTPSAQRLGAFLDSIHPYISIGIGVNPRQLPIILHTANTYSNGYVTWAPRREELVMIPPASTYALLWSRQLAAHEWRHVTQITALNHGLTKIASWLMGEAGYALGLAVMSSWQLEGDATLAETQLAEFGRGLQPDFTVGYRTLFDSGRNKFKRIDPWICGSYNFPAPDVYHYGYQVMSAAENYISKDIWGEILRFSGKWPILIFPDAFLLKTKYKTSYGNIARRAFAEMDSMWKPLADVKENFQQISTDKPHNYTTYRWPMKSNSGRAVAIKTDWTHPTRLVELDNKDRTVKYVGNISSRTAMQGQTVYWTQYKQHPIYEQHSFSSIVALDLETRRSQVKHRWDRNYFVTPMAGKGFATVALDDQLHSYIQFFDQDFKKTNKYSFGADEINLHGLAYDSLSGTLAYIALDQSGMWIGALDSTLQSRQITRPSVVTVSDLTASDGRLYFSSIQSGKNEIHTIDLLTGNEYRLTDSRFGSQAATATGDTMLFTTSRALGEMVARATTAIDSSSVVQWSRLPRNTVNPKRYQWPVAKMDTIKIEHTQQEAKNVKRYRRFGQMFNLHSWAPVSFDGDYLMSDRDLQLALGVTAFFQSPMSDLTGFATYGYVNNSNWLKGHFLYKGLPLDISLAAEYGGGDQLQYGTAPISGGALNPYFSFTSALSLPLNFTGGHSSRLLQPSFTVQYNNSLLLNTNTNTYDMGLVRYDASLWWSSTRRTAYRDVTPRLGYALKLSVSGAFDRRLGTLYSLWTRGYLPGIGANHSITLKAAAQVQDFSMLNFSSKVLTPRGYYDPWATKQYTALAMDYTAPVAYPDWGLDGVLYFKRIWASLFGDLSMGRYMVNDGGLASRYGYSYGVNIGVDVTVFRTFPQSFSMTFALPRDQKFFFGFNYSVNFSFK